jgi:phage tail tube protein FII
MNRAQNRAKSKKEANKLLGYTKRHHIIPKAIGGLDIKENIAYLTAKEHYIAHLLLTKLYPKHPGLLAAIVGFNAVIGERDKISKSALYEKRKIEFSNIRKGENKTNSERVKKISKALTGRTKETHEGNRRQSEKIKGRTKETDEGVKKISEALTGRTKETDEGYRKISEKRKGRTKENCEYVKRHSELMLGRTKETHEGLAKMAETLTGRTKETHPGIKRQSEKMTGRTKENDEGMKKMAEKLTGRTKDNHPSIAKMSENKFKIKQPYREEFFNRYLNNEDLQEIYNNIISIYPELKFSYVEALFKRMSKQKKQMDK